VSRSVVGHDPDRHESAGGIAALEFTPPDVEAALGELVTGTEIPDREPAALPQSNHAPPVLFFSRIARLAVGHEDALPSEAIAPWPSRTVFAERTERRETGKESWMKESHGKGPASHPDPESCVDGRKAGSEALTGAHAGQPCTDVELDSGGNIVAGNFIGTDVSGSVDLAGAYSDGILVFGNGKQIGNGAPGDRN
jgi:hypothetical protein